MSKKITHDTYINLVCVVSLLSKGWENFLAYQTLLIFTVFEEGLRWWGRVVWKVFAVIETWIVLLFVIGSLVRGFHWVSFGHLGVVVVWVCMLHVAASLNQWKLFQILIVWIWWDPHVTSIFWTFIVPHLQVWQFLLCLSEFVVTVLLRGVNGWYLALFIILRC